MMWKIPLLVACYLSALTCDRGLQKLLAKIQRIKKLCSPRLPDRAGINLLGDGSQIFSFCESAAKAEMPYPIGLQEIESPPNIGRLTGHVLRTIQQQVR